MSRTMQPLYPEITLYVDLTGPGGNAFAILGTIKREFRRHHIPAEEWSRFEAEATYGDYNHLLATCEKWVTFVAS
jgi:hypothetical protein